MLDETERKPKHLVQTFGPEEGFPTFDEALVEYKSHQWAQSIRTGSYTRLSHDFYSDDPNAFKHEVLIPSKLSMAVVTSPIVVIRCFSGRVVCAGASGPPLRANFVVSG